MRGRGEFAEAPALAGQAEGAGLEQGGAGLQQDVARLHARGIDGRRFAFAAYTSATCGIAR